MGSLFSSNIKFFIMNDAHLHLVVNHLPIIFPIVAVLLLVAGIFLKSSPTRRNAYAVFILGAVASAIAMATGDGAEEAVEHIAGVSENFIKTHEEAAELFAGVSYFVGAVSAFALFSEIRNLKFSKFLAPIVLLLSLGMMYFAQEAGRTGGEIRHTEIRSSAANQNAAHGTEKGGEAGEDHDD